jgi:alginate O-acetyltransferase complex protein AlgJ
MPSPDVLARRDPAGPDFPGRRTVERMLGLATVAILGIGLWQGIAAIATPGAQRRLAEVMRLDAFLAGRTAAAINHVMAHDLPGDGKLRAAGGVFRWMVFGAGSAQVTPGCGDWLFLTEELRPWPGAEAAMAERAALLAAVAARLAAQDIALRVAVVPDKARMVAGQRCGAPYSAQAQARLPAFAALLAAGDITSIDLAAVLRDGAALFWRTDTHWNQEGARRAAVALAETLPEAIARETEFRTSAALEETDGPGDLLRLMSLDQVPNGLRPRPDRQRVEQTDPVEAAEAESILDEAPVPELVLIGSSFSVNANFHGALQQAARAPVANQARAGGGFAGAARQYFASPAWRETPPRVIFWEIPERVLGQPLSDDDRALRAWLEAPPAPR